MCRVCEQSDNKGRDVISFSAILSKSIHTNQRPKEKADQSVRPLGGSNFRQAIIVPRYAGERRGTLEELLCSSVMRWKPIYSFIQIPFTSICRTGARKGICLDHIIVKTAPLSNKICLQIPTDQTITLTWRVKMSWQKLFGVGTSCLGLGGKDYLLLTVRFPLVESMQYFMWGKVSRNQGWAQGHFSPSMFYQIRENDSLFEKVYK